MPCTRRPTEASAPGSRCGTRVRRRRRAVGLDHGRRARAVRRVAGASRRSASARRWLRLGRAGAAPRRSTGASVVGIDLLEEGIASDPARRGTRPCRTRAVRQVDAEGPLPFDDGSFDAVLSTDAMCHLPHRARHAPRVAPRDRTRRADPLHRSDHRHRPRHRRRGRGPELGRRLRLLRAAVNEELLAQAGFELVRREDLTENMASMAGRWHDARERPTRRCWPTKARRRSRRSALPAACHLLARERRLSRHAYLAER